MTHVLDASALLALLFDERGGALVLNATRGSYVSTVNLVEILAKCQGRGMMTDDVHAQLARLKITISPFSQREAEIAADMLRTTRPFGLSLGDRACLALAQALDLPVLTADRAWAQLDIDVDIQLIR